MTYIRPINRFMYNHIDVTLLTQPLAEQLFNNAAHNIQKIDLSGFTEVRVLCFVARNSSSANSPKLSLQYNDTYSTTPSDYDNIGSSAVEISLATAGLIDSGWVSLIDAAKADVFLCLIQSGGDGVQSPEICRTFIELR